MHAKTRTSPPDDSRRTTRWTKRAVAAAAESRNRRDPRRLAASFVLVRSECAPTSTLLGVPKRPDARLPVPNTQIRGPPQTAEAVDAERNIIFVILFFIALYLSH